jgi:hypothetical protein
MAMSVTACGNSLEERAGSGVAIGAGAGAAIGVVASPAVIGGALVGAAAGGTVGLAVHDTKVNGSKEPTGVVLRQLLKEQARLWNVSDPILTQGSDICREWARANFGFVAWTRWDIDRQFRIASMGEYGLDNRLRVVHILPGSPAAAAGLRAGDEIERVGMHDMPTGKAAGTAMELIVRREAKAGVAQRFRVRRGDVRHSFEIAARRQCDIDLVVTASDRINGFSYGRTIYMTDGLMRYFSDDQELAAVAAHFLGHVVLQHEADRDESKLTGQLDSLETASLDEGTRDERKKSGSLPGAQIYTEMQEIQADRAALELLARADYPMEALAEVWQRLAETESEAIILGDFHPASPERKEAVQDILDQVRTQGGSTKPQPES